VRLARQHALDRQERVRLAHGRLVVDTAWLRRSRAPRSGPPARTARGSYTYGPRGSSSGPRGRGHPGGRCAPDSAGGGRGPPGLGQARVRDLLDQRVLEDVDGRPPRRCATTLAL